MAAGKCTAAYHTDEWHGYGCDITGGACMFLFPDSKACAREYGEGPDAIVRPVHEKWLVWSGGVDQKSEKIYCSMLERPVMAYRLKGSSQDGQMVTLPFLAEDGNVYYYIFDHEGYWIEDPVMVGEYTENMECWPENWEEETV